MCLPASASASAFLPYQKRYTLLQKDLKTLRHRTWINDEVVNAFLWLVNSQLSNVFVHTTFFLTTLMGPRG